MVSKTEVGATVVEVGATVVEVGALGIPDTAFEAGESPIAFTALMVTEYAVPFVRPLIVNGLAVVTGFNAT
jgi:hypothetical protein